MYLFIQVLKACRVKKEVLILVAVIVFQGCASMEENRISSLITAGTISVKQSQREGADFEVTLPTLWGNGWDSDEPKDRRWFVKEIVTQKRKCLDNGNAFRIVGESKEFSHAEDIARIAVREYYIYHVHIACGT